MKKRGYSIRDLTGQIFGYLTVVSRCESMSFNGHNYARWLCKCECGNDFKALHIRLLSGGNKSCGCKMLELQRQSRITHGMSKTRIYCIWKGIIDRCYRKNNRHFQYYGGRGIKVCDRWLNSFENFYNDVGDPPSNNHSIDRYPNNDGNYEPGNWRWATTDEQAYNKRNTKIINYNGTAYTLDKFAYLFGLKRNTLYIWIRKLKLSNVEIIEKAILIKAKRQNIHEKRI